MTWFSTLYPENPELDMKAFLHVIDEEHPEYLNGVQNLALPWPTHLIGQKKIIEQLNYILSITLPEKSMVEWRTLEDLLNVISVCDVLLQSKVEFDDDRILAERRMKEFRPNLKTMKNFIVNVPSDYFRVLHPKYKAIRDTCSTKDHNINSHIYY